MADFNVRSDSVNVEQIMEQIRARIREKRGVDYTEQQIRELAAVKLEKFLDPKGVRSDLLEQFRKAQPAYEPPELPNYSFEDATLYETHRAPLRFIRKLLNPILKLFFNPNLLVRALHIQSRLNTMYAEREARREAARRATDQLTYELIHNLVLEVTRSSIEVKNLKMRVESLGSRLEFNERRARALESVVVYKTPQEDLGERIAAPRSTQQPAAAQRQSQQPTAHAAPELPAAHGVSGEGPGQRSRRRRRRRGRRGGGSAAATMGAQQSDAESAGASIAEGTEIEPESSHVDSEGEHQHDAAGTADSQTSAAAPEIETGSPAGHVPSDRPGHPEAPATEDLENMSGAESHPSEPPDRESQ